LNRAWPFWLPCTTAAVAAWYSRIWRTPERRVQTLVWAALIALAVAVLVWRAPPSGPPSTRWAVPDNARRWLDGHWLAWCLCRRQIRNETIVCGFWRAEEAVLKLLALCLLIAQWVAIYCAAGGTVVRRICAGLSIDPPAPPPSRNANTAGTSIHTMPALICLQAAWPWGWLLCAGGVALAVGTIAAYAVHSRNPHLLTAASVMATGGCAFNLIRLNPGMAALYDLLAWTGVSLRWCLTRALRLPAAFRWH